LGAARPIISEKPSEEFDLVSKIVSGDRPKTAITFSSVASQEIAQIHSGNSPNPPLHTAQTYQAEI